MAFGIGIIGPGTIGRVHLRTFQAIRGVRVPAIAARTRDTVERVGDEYGIERRFVDFRELLALPEVDAVSICTPVETHAEIAVAAARAGKHVMCEKPMAGTYPDAEAMLAECAAAGVQLAVLSGRARAGLYPLTADMTAARAEADRLGQLFYARVSGPWRFKGRPGLDILTDAAWFLDPRQAGGGVIADLGCYAIDLLLYLAGDPQPLTVSAGTFRGMELEPSGLAYEVEEQASIYVRFAGGLVACLELANASHVERDDSFSLMLCGSRGTLRLRGFPFTAGTTVSLSCALPGRIDLPLEDVFAARDQPGLLHSEWDLPPAPRSLFDDFVFACQEGRSPVASGEAGLRVMQVITAAYLSAAVGREVAVDELTGSGG